MLRVCQSTIRCTSNACLWIKRAAAAAAHWYHPGTYNYVNLFPGTAQQLPNTGRMTQHNWICISGNSSFRPRLISAFWHPHYILRNTRARALILYIYGRTNSLTGHVQDLIPKNAPHSDCKHIPTTSSSSVVVVVRPRTLKLPGPACKLCVPFPP